MVKLPIGTHHVNGIFVPNFTDNIATEPAITPKIAAFSPVRFVSTPNRKTPSRIPSVTDAIDRPDSSTEPHWLATIAIPPSTAPQNTVDSRDTRR